LGVDVVASIDEAVGRERIRARDARWSWWVTPDGGVIAALVAARRGDVALLVTFAAPLNVVD
jgi:hypothetical protein